MQARLLDLLVAVLPTEHEAFVLDGTTEAWWKLEGELRKDLSIPIDLERLQTLGRMSQRSLNRACRRATGMPPMQRVKQKRMSYARALVLHSLLTMSEIAHTIAYNRVQEFSRDYHRTFGVTPTQDRKAGPDYRELKVAD